MNILKFILIVCALISNIVQADVSVYKSKIGTIEINLPLPDGFVEPTGLMPKLKTVAENFTPSSNRHLAYMVQTSDAALMLKGIESSNHRYFLIQTLRAAEDMSFSDSTFAQVRKVLREQASTLFKVLGSDIQNQLNDGAKKTASMTQLTELDFKAGVLNPIETFLDTTNSIALLGTIKYQVTINGKSEELPVVMVVMPLLLKGKLIYFNCYSRYESDMDIEWVKSQASAWLEQARLANQ